MPEEKYRYYVAYQLINKKIVGGNGIGASEAQTSMPIMTFDQIIEIAKAIAEREEYEHAVIITILPLSVGVN